MGRPKRLFARRAVSAILLLIFVGSGLLLPTRTALSADLTQEQQPRAEELNLSPEDMPGGSGREQKPPVADPPEPPMPFVVGFGPTAVGSSGSAALPVGTQAGDMAIWHMAYGEQGAVGGPPLVPGWTLLHYDVAPGSSDYGAGIALFYRFLDGSEHGVLPAIWHGEVDLARITVFRGVSDEDPFEGAALASGASGTRSLPSLTTTGANRLAACFGSQVQGPSNAFSGETGGDWVSSYEVGDGADTDMRFSGHLAELPTATTVSGATSASTSFPWMQRCLALVPGEAEPAVADAPQLRLYGAASIGSNGSAVVPAGARKGELALWYMGYNHDNTGAIGSSPTVSGWTLLHFDQTTGTSRLNGQSFVDQHSFGRHITLMIERGDSLP
jgi:hypothetical protein